MAALVLMSSSMNVWATEATETAEMPKRVDKTQTKAAMQSKTQPIYRIGVNRQLNCVTVYLLDGTPIISFSASTGKNNKTPTETTKISDKYEFHTMKGISVYAQYATRFNNGCMFHAVPCTARKKSSLKTSYYNQLGEQASSGCVRLACADAKWIYDHCTAGTVVEVYDDSENPGPLGKPMIVRIPEGSPYANWDPTDPDPANPWVSVRPVVKLVANSIDETTLTLPAGASYETLYNSLSLLTPEGVAYTDGNYALDIFGKYDLNTPGNYELYIRGYDIATTLRGDLDITLQVVAN